MVYRRFDSIGEPAYFIGSARNKHWPSHLSSEEQPQIHFSRNARAAMSNTQIPATPVGESLHEQLRAKIRADGFETGDQFLTEREVARQFKVSRATANKALSRLVAEGWLEFRKGAGTFVRDGVLDYDLRQLVSFTEKARSAGKKPSTKVLSFEELAASAVAKSVRAALEVSNEEKLFRFERRRLADNVPVIFEKRWVVARHCPKLSRANVRGSLYSYWMDKCGLEVVGAEESIRAVNLNSMQSELLDVLSQTAALRVLSTGYISNNEPLWFEETLYRTDAYEFRNRLGGLKSSGPAVGGFT